MESEDKSQQPQLGTISARYGLDRRKAFILIEG